MDPLAHTLVGASLATTRLKRLTPLVTPTLILGANAPDIDVVTMLVSRDLSLGFRRGWTHGILAMLVLPLVLAGLVLLVDRAVAGARGRDPCRRPGRVVMLAYLGVLTHPFLDWLNTYGIRLLMPFDDRWFYGDALFVIDPWVWLATGTAVALSHSATAGGKIVWLMLSVVLTALVTSVEGVPVAARLAWLVGVAVIFTVRVTGGPRIPLSRLAGACLAGTTIYIGAMLAASGLATRQVAAWLSERDDTPVEIMTAPLPANPFVRDVVVVDERHYHLLQVNWLRREPIRIAGPTIERAPSPEDPVVRAARMAPHVQGLITWIRFPAYRVEALSDGYRVTITDVRYARRTSSGLGDAVVELDRGLRVRTRD